ncbi:hypothetical protein ACLBWT_12215 [Paenibacillus sp. D51F]
MDEKKIETHFGDVKGASINIASDSNQTTVNYTESVRTNTALDKATADLLSLVKAHLNPETATVVSGMINDAATEAKKADKKDTSKIKGLISVVGPLLKAVPEAIETFTSWTSLIEDIF